MSSSHQIAGTKRGRCGHAHTPVSRKKSASGPDTQKPVNPAAHNEKASVPDPVVLYGGPAEYTSPLDARYSSTPCSDATWMSNAYFSSPSVCSTPYPNRYEFQQQQDSPSSGEAQRRFDMRAFGVNDNDNMQGYIWSQPQQDALSCGDSPPCTDPTCADTLPCPEADLSCPGFECPEDEICYDQHCLPDGLATDICFDELCQTRCPSPCFNQQCAVPECNDLCPVTSTHADCPPQITSCDGDCSVENGFDCYGPPCGCIDPQCLQRNHEGCNHELFPGVAFAHQPCVDTSSSRQKRSHAEHQYTHQQFEQLLGPLMSAQHENKEHPPHSKRCDHASHRGKSHISNNHQRPHAHHRVHGHVHRFGSHALNDEGKEVYDCLWCLPGSSGEGDTVCGSAFASAEELHQHLEQEHVDSLQREDLENNGFFCRWQGCDRFMCRSFHARPKLKRHLQTHTLYKPFVCSKCGIQMKTKDAMEKHERTHTGERPYECNVLGCKKIFATSTELKTHMVVHSGLKPHTCPICGEGFADSSNLSKHKKTHFVGMYRCLTCGARMKRWDQMRRHIVTQGHSTELLEDKVAQRDYKVLMEKEFKELPESERMIG